MFVYIYIHIYIYIYIYIICEHKRSQRLLHVVRLCINDTAATPCRSMPWCAMRQMMNTLGTLYVSFGLTFMLMLSQPLVSFGLTAQ